MSKSKKETTKTAKVSKAKTSNAKTAKTTKEKVVKDQITAKQYGRNIVMVVDGEKYSRAFNEKEERSDMLLTVDSYNAKPTKKLKIQILNTMLEYENEKVKATEEVKEAKKNVKAPAKKQKPKNVEPTVSELEKAKQLLEANNYVVSKSAPKRRSGEY